MEDLTKYSDFKKSELMKEYLLLKTNPLQFLFDGMGDLSVFAEKDDSILEFEVQVRHSGDEANPWDCKVSNFGINRFFRTEKGREGKKYKTLGLMLRAIEQGLQKEISAKAKYYVISLNKYRRV